MKKVIILSNISIGAQIAKKIKDEDLQIVVNNAEVKDFIRKQHLDKHQDSESVLNFSETKTYDKPKSKYHK